MREESNEPVVILLALRLETLASVTASSAICVVPTPPDLTIRLPLPSVSIVTSSICKLFAFKVPVVMLSAFRFVTATLLAFSVPVVTSSADIVPKTPDADVSVPEAILPATIVDDAISDVVIVPATISEAVTEFAAILS